MNVALQLGVALAGAPLNRPPTASDLDTAGVTSIGVHPERGGLARQHEATDRHAADPPLIRVRPLEAELVSKCKPYAVCIPGRERPFGFKWAQGRLRLEITG